MTMRPFTDNRGGLNHLVDAQIGRAFPVVHKVHQHLDAIEYVAQVYEAGRARDIVIRTNHTKEWIEWQYKGEAKWTILFKFSDLLGADIADVVAAERALAAELEQLRLQLNNDTEDTLEARDAAIAARTGAEAALATTVTARDAAQASRTAAAQSALTAGQHAQNLEAAKTAAQQSATQAAAERTLANQAAQTAQGQATAAGASATSAAEARQAAAGFAAEANAAKSATALLQSAAGQSAQAASQSEAAARGAADEASIAATAAGVSAESAAAHQVATEAAATAGAQHLADIEAQVVSAEALKQETVDAQQASLAAKASAEEAAVNAATFAENAGVSAAESITSANEAEASANSAELSAQNAAAYKAEAESQAVAAEASALASAASATVSSEKLGEVSTLHGAVVTASTAATEAADTTTAHLAQVTALHSATETFSQVAQASAEQADIAATAAGVSASDALQLRNETQGFHDAASTMVVDAAQVSADRATVQTLTQEVQLAANQAQSNALAAADSANAANDSATIAQTSASEILGQVTTLSGRLDEADSIVTTVTALRDETLSYKLAAQDSTVNAQAVAADRAAVAGMMGTIAADAASAADSKDQALAAAATATQAEAAAVNAEASAAAANAAKTSATDSATQATTALTGVVPLHTEVVDKHADVLVRAVQVAEDLLATDAAKNAAESAQAIAETAEALARAWATKMDGPVLNDGDDKFSAQYWAAQAEQLATDATDVNTGALAAVTNHIIAADPHAQYLTKAESVDALASKVDNVIGKQLSTEDYTSAEKAKLASVENGANAYIHPAKHPASIITQDENNRFVSDAEKAAWNAKQAALVSGTNIKTINGVSLLGGGDVAIVGAKPSLQGDPAPYVTQTKTYQVTNYNSFSSYAVSASAGTASISGDTITFTAPATAGSVNLTLTVDGQPAVFVINVQAAGVAKPTNTSPVNGATGIPDSPTLQSSAFAAYGLTDTHLASRWTVYQGGVEVHSSGWRTDALTSYAVPAGVMVVSTGYAWTVEHRGNALGDSPASTATSFTTAASFNSYIPTPTPTPENFGNPLEGGFYAGMVWGQIAQSSTSMAIATGSKTFTVADMSSAPIVYGGQMVEVRSRANPANKFVGTVTGALGTSLTINVTSIGGSGTFSDWSIMARHRVIVAPKASGEHAGIALKNANSALPTACQTLTEGFAATQAMRDADSSTVYPAAHWARGLSIGGRSDWYIPARDELELCWRNLKPVTNDNHVTANRPTGASFNYANNGSYGDTASTHGLNNNSSPAGAAYTASVPAQTAATAFRIGGTEAYEFGSMYYWSSSDYDASSAWYQYWNSSNPGGQGGSGKSGTRRVRAVRRSVI